MSSPCKRTKVFQRGSLRTTLESKVTSTPQGSNASAASPSVSAISSRENDISSPESFDGREEQREGTSSYPSVRSSSPVSMVSEVVYTDLDMDYNAYLRNLGKIKYTGVVWNLHKPQKENSLYAQILGDPLSPKVVICELFLCYNQNPKKALLDLIQLCVDACGLQHFDVSKHYRFRENSAEEIVNMLQTKKVVREFAASMPSGRYLFMESQANIAKTLKIAIYYFLQEFIFCSHSNGVLYEEFLSKKFFMFVKCMSFSDLACVRHTGVIFAAKLMTALVKTYDRIVNDSNYHTDDSMGQHNSATFHLQEQKLALEYLLEYFYLIYIKNCLAPDIKLLQMRVECILEMQIWVKSFPKMFIGELQAVNYLKKLIIDEAKDVRYTALVACEQLLQTEYVTDFLKPYIQELTEAVHKRFFDVNPKVAVKAIEIFTIIWKFNLNYRDESLMSPHSLKVMTSMVFDKYFPIGEAACKFMVLYLRQFSKHSEKVLKNLAKMAMLRKPWGTELLVEGCLYIVDEIRNWKLYVKVLTDKDSDLSLLEALAEILAEAVYQTLKGKSSVLRANSRIVVHVDAAEHTKVARQISHFNQLLQLYHDHPKILIQIFKIFPLVNSDLLVGNYCKEYIDLCNVIEQLFNEHTNIELLKEMVEVLDYLSKAAHFSERARVFIHDFSGRIVSKLFTCISQPNTEDCCTSALKVSLLYEHFDLNRKFSCEILFDKWEEVDEMDPLKFESMVNLLQCCKWCLIWNLKSLTSGKQKLQPGDLSSSSLLQQTCYEFTTICFNMLRKLKGQDLHLRVYQGLCDFYINYHNILEAPIKLDKRFESFQQKIEEPLQNVLTSFVEKCIICNNDISLNDKRENVVRYVELAHKNIIPLTCLSYIFQYYHEYNSEYGEIIEFSLNSMVNSDDENTIIVMVVSVLKTVYEQILNKHGVFDIGTEEAKYLKMLVKQFLAFKYFCKPKVSFINLLLFSIAYALSEERKYGFLYFAQYFIKLVVDTDSHNKVFDSFKRKLPEGAEKHDAILFFADHLKSAIKSSSKKAKSTDKSTFKSASNTAIKVPKKKTPNENVRQNSDTSSNSSAIRDPNPLNIVSSRNRKSLEGDTTQTEVDMAELTTHDTESDCSMSIANLRI